MSGISLQSGIIYGPVFSRRLGRSLGINLLSTEYKVCSFNCIYCQYGPGYCVTISPDEEVLPTIDQVLASVERALKKPRSLDYLTFSGNGEPTIHPDFPLIVQGVKALRDRLCPDVKLALLSNSSRIMDSIMSSTLRLIDTPMMKLDAGDEKAFHTINRPVKSVELVEIIKGLKEVPNLIVQSVLIDGIHPNIHGDTFINWVEAVREINPTEVHIYSTERPTAEEGVICVTPKKLLKIQELLRDKFGLVTKAFWSE